MQYAFRETKTVKTIFKPGVWGVTPDENRSIRVDSDQAKPITQPESYLNTFWGALFLS